MRVRRSTCAIFSEAAAIRTGDALDRAVGTVDVPLLSSMVGLPFRSTYWVCHLAILKQLLQPLVICHEAALANGKPDDIPCQFCLCQPRNLLETTWCIPSWIRGGRCLYRSGVGASASWPTIAPLGTSPSFQIRAWKPLRKIPRHRPSLSFNSFMTASWILQTLECGCRISAEPSGSSPAEKPPGEHDDLGLPDFFSKNPRTPGYRWHPGWRKNSCASVGTGTAQAFRAVVLAVGARKYRINTVGFATLFADVHFPWHHTGLCSPVAGVRLGTLVFGIPFPGFLSRHPWPHPWKFFMSPYTRLPHRSPRRSLRKPR